MQYRFLFGQCFKENNIILKNINIRTDEGCIESPVPVPRDRHDMVFNVLKTKEGLKMEPEISY